MGTTQELEKRGRVSARQVERLRTRKVGPAGRSHDPIAVHLARDARIPVPEQNTDDTRLRADVQHCLKPPCRRTFWARNESHVRCMLAAGGLGLDAVERFVDGVGDDQVGWPRADGAGDGFRGDKFLGFSPRYDDPVFALSSPGPCGSSA
ncbi:MAG TPA: hypothetical protein VF933_32210 [Streptosporangiaceae bacterium]